TRNERAAQQPAVGIGLAEHPELAAGVVCARARVAGQHQDHSELVGWRRSEQLREDLDNLARPEELVLEVDEGASRAESPDVRLQDREVAEREASVDALGHGPRDLHRDVARRLLGLRWRQLLAGNLQP